MSSLNISFSQIPAMIRKPGQYLEYNTRLANNSLPAYLQKVLLVGQRISTGTVAELVVTQLFSDADAADFFGVGSILYLMARAAIKTNPYLQLFAIANDDASGSAARVETVTIAGTIADAGWVRLWIGDVYVQVSYAATDTAIAIATALKSALDGIYGLPFTYSRTDAVITFTARNKGTLANQIPFTCEVSPVGGATETAAQTTTGSGDPDLHATGGVSDKIAPAQYHIIASSLNDATSLGYIKTHLDTVSGPVEQRPGRCVAGYVGTIASLQTIADTVGSGRIGIGFVKASKTPAFSIGAMIAAALASLDDPALSLNGKQLPAMSPPHLNDRTTRTEQETCLLHGITPLEVGPGETVEIVRMISTYQTDSVWLDFNTVGILDYVREAIRVRIKARYGQSKLNDRVIGDVRSEIIIVLKQLESLEIIENVDANLDGVLAERDSVDANRIDAKIPCDIVNNLHVFAGRIDLII